MTVMETPENSPIRPDNTRYALWLVPRDDVAKQLADAIDYLCGHYRGPSFKPHVTLLSNISGLEEDLISKTKKLGQDLQELTLKATGLAMEPYYFRSFYLKLESAAGLLLAFQNAAKNFGLRGSGNYTPHVSLSYGFTTREEKIAMGRDIHKRLPGSLEFSHLQLVQVALAVPDWQVVCSVDL